MHLLPVLLALLPARAADPDTVAVKARVELEAHRSDHVEVLPQGKAGFLVLSQDADYKNGQIHAFDASFNEVATWALPKDALYRPCPHDVTAEHARLCFFAPKTGLHVVTVPTQGDLTIQDLDLPQRWVDAVSWTPSGLWLVNGFGETWEGPVRKADLVKVDLAAGTVQPVDASIPGKGKTYLQGFHETPSGGVWVESGRMKGAKRSLSLVSLPADGSPAPLTLPDSGSYVLLTARLVEQSSGNRLLTGTWASHKGDTTADGLWLAPMQGDVAGTPSFLSFSDFKHYFDYLPDRSEKAVQKKIEKKKAKGKIVDVPTWLDVREVIDQGSRLLVVGEVRLARYNVTTTTTTTTTNGVTTTTTTTHTTFIGWQTTHVVVAALSKDGALLWDQSLPLDAELIPAPRRHVQVSVQGEDVRLLYVSNRQIVAQTIRGDEVTGAQRELARATTEADEEVKRAFSSGSAPWVDGDWLLWGVEKVRSEEDGKRIVFSVSRVGE